MNPLVIGLYYHLKDCQQYPSDVWPQEELQVPRSPAASSFLPTKMLTVVSTIRPIRSCPLMCPNLVLKSPFV